MPARHRIGGRAAAAAFAAVALTGALGARPASAFLGIDWFSCRPDDGLRRQFVVLHKLAHATGKVPSDDEASEKALNTAILSESFGAGDKGNPSRASVDENGVGVYPDATAATIDANDGVLGDDGSGDPPVEDVFIADPEGATIPPDDGGGGDGGDPWLPLQ